LQKLGLVQRQRYRAIFLTRAGEKLALQVSHRHSIVLEFLLSLGVARATAENDAEGIEHHVSEATLRAFERHVRVSASKKKRGAR
jgi:DtxR family manganese transport transcriptional regulator